MRLPGIIVLGVFISLFIAVMTQVLSLIVATEDWNALLMQSNYLLRTIVFTISQAFLSLLISLFIAIVLAHAIFHSQFKGKRLFIQITSLAIVIPTVVSVFAIIAVHGQQGWVAKLFSFFGLPFDGYLYGFSGILLAHVFLNTPLLIRVFLQSLNTLPTQTWKTASQLNLSAWGMFCYIEWPLIKTVMASSCALVFFLCFTSFIVVLTLGGGPQHTTLEVAIFQALRFDFDFSKVAILGVIQLGLCVLIYVLFFYRQGEFSYQLLNQQAVNHTQLGSTDLILNKCIIIIYALFMLSPMAAIIAGLSNINAWQVVFRDDFKQALLGSLKISFLSTSLCMVMALSLLELQRVAAFKKLKILIDLSVKINLIFPPILLSACIYLLFRQHVFQWAYLIVAVINALFALPFVIKIIEPASKSLAFYNQLYDSLNINGLRRYALNWPLMATSVGIATGICMAISLGDLSAIMLFQNNDLSTLPLYMYQLMASYQMDQAAIIGFLICLLCLCLYQLAQLLIGRKNADT